MNVILLLLLTHTHVPLQLSLTRILQVRPLMFTYLHHLIYENFLIWAEKSKFNFAVISNFPGEDATPNERLERVQQRQTFTTTTPLRDESLDIDSHDDGRKHRSAGP